MYRYVGVFRTDSSVESEKLCLELVDEISRSFPGGRDIYNSGRLRVTEWPDQNSRMACHVLSDDLGVVLGHFFTPKPSIKDISASVRAPINLSDNESRNIILDDCEYLTDHYWGSYIALLHDKPKNTLRVFRSPFGQLPCFHFNVKGISIIFSHVEIFSILAKYGLKIDWSYIPLYMTVAASASERTAFEGLEFLNHSQLLTISDKKKSYHFAWDPVRYAKHRLVGPVDEVGRHLRQVAFRCFEAWSSVFSRGILRLSGGFDSSLVAGILAQIDERPEIICVTMYDQSPLNDERHYARRTAQKTGYPLAEIPINAAAPDFEIFNNFPKLPWPYLLGTHWSQLEDEARIAHESGGLARFTGTGGDVLFGLLKQNLAARDYYADNGIDSNSFKVAMNSAIVSNISLWSALKSMITVKSNERFMIREAFADPDNIWGQSLDIRLEDIERLYVPPWDGASSDIAPGRRTVIRSIMGINDYFNPTHNVSFLEPIHPLLSQPIVELCLAIPTYVHQFDGRERGLARRVFADCLVDEVRLRQFKSNGSTFDCDMVIAHRSFFADFILGGILAERGLIDRKAIKTAINDPSSCTARQYGRIAYIASLEAWVRSWC